MAKKTATYSTYELRVEDGGKIVILNSGELVANAMGAIRTIAAEAGFELETKWNTQTSGRKLVDFLNSSAPATPSAEVKVAPVETPNPKPSTPSKTSAPTKSEAKLNEEELTPEEMKQLDEILKRLETLEARIAKLEKSPATVTEDGQLYVVATLCDSFDIMKRNADGSLVPKWYNNVSNIKDRDEVYGHILQGNYINYQSETIPPLMLLSNGDIIRRGGSISNGSSDCTIRETKAFATQMGIEAPDKATMPSLAATIMAKYGRNGWCVGNGSLLSGSGVTYTYSVVDFTSYMNSIVGSAGLAKELPAPDLTGKSVEEKQRIASDYLSKVIAYPLPPKEKVIEEFKKACEEFDKKGK